MRYRPRSNSRFSLGYLSAVTALAAAFLFQCGMANEFQRSPAQDMAELVDQDWVSDTGITMTPGTILTLHARQGVSYEWGGPPGGVRFVSNGRFAEYENVLCSTESSPVRRSGETWRVVEDGSIEVCGPRRRLELEVLSRTACCLELRVLAAEDAGCEP